MAEDQKEEEQSTEGDEPQKKFKISIPLMVVIGLVLMALITFLVAYVITHKKVEPEVTETQQEQILEEEMGQFYAMDEFIVNLVDYSGRRYLKASIELELDIAALAEEIDGKKAYVRNIIINILSSKTFNDISTIDGKNSLREEITFRINNVMKSGKVKNVYFNEFVVQ